MGKTLIILFLFLTLVSLVLAANYDYIYNPYTSKQDRSLSLNQSGNNFTADYFFGRGTNLTNIPWVNLESYPVPCPVNTFMTAVNDSNTCAAVNVTALNITSTTYSNSSPITLTTTVFGLLLCSDTQILKMSGSNWICSTDDTGSSVGDGNNYTTSIQISGTATKTMNLARNGMVNLTASWTDIDTDTTYTNGTGLTLNGTEFSHTDTSAEGSSDNSGRTYIQDISLDIFGHVTDIVTATETIVDTNDTVRVIALETSNTTQAASITSLDLSNTSQAARLTALELSNTSQGASIVSLDLSNTSQATRLTALETSNTTQSNAITALQTDNTTQATLINNLLASITSLDLSNTTQSNAIAQLVVSNTSQGASIVSLDLSNTTQSGDIAKLVVSNTTQGASITSLDLSNTTQSGDIAKLVDSNGTQDTLIDGKLNLTGGAMTGNITFSANVGINASSVLNPFWQTGTESVTSTLPAANISTGTFGTGDYTFPGNTTVNSNILIGNGKILSLNNTGMGIYITSNSSCTIIKGATTTWNVC